MIDREISERHLEADAADVIGKIRVGTEHYLAVTRMSEFLCVLSAEKADKFTMKMSPQNGRFAAYILTQRGGTELLPDYQYPLIKNPSSNRIELNEGSAVNDQSIFQWSYRREQIGDVLYLIHHDLLKQITSSLTVDDIGQPLLQPLPAAAAGAQTVQPQMVQNILYMSLQ